MSLVIELLDVLLQDYLRRDCYNIIVIQVRVSSQGSDRNFLNIRKLSQENLVATTLLSKQTESFICVVVKVVIYVRVKAQIVV